MANKYCCNVIIEAKVSHGGMDAMLRQSFLAVAKGSRDMVTASLSASMRSRHEMEGIANSSRTSRTSRLLVGVDSPSPLIQK
jgi:hypothetical protein